MLARPALADDFSRAEVFGGYQYTRIGIAPGENANGWNGALTGYVRPWFGVTADFSGAYRAIGPVNLRAHTYTFGPTFAHRGGRLTPFAHVLAGGFHASAGFQDIGAGLNGFALLAGGGLNVEATRHLAVRLFQADWLLWRGAGVTEKKNARISAGIVIRID